MACLLATSCTRSHNEAVERLAILPLENLTSDASLDWISSASTAMLAYDLTGPRAIHPIRVASLRDARLGRATLDLEGYFAFEHGALAFHVSIMNVGTRRISRALVVRASADDPARAMNQMSKDLSPEARAFPACPAAAIRAYGEALAGRASFEAVAKADPHCMPVYLAWAEAALARGDRDAVTRICSTALTLPDVDAIDRAEIHYVSATAKNETAGRLQSLKRLSTLLPSDADVLRNIADLELGQRDIQDAVHSFEEATRFDPEDGATWNSLGYARAYLHDLAGAREAIERYQKLALPEDANPLDSLGEVSFYLADFKAAEREFLAAHEKTSGAASMFELLKAAQAHIMSGDLAGADRLLASPPGLPAFYQAQWEFLTGRRAKAIAAMQALAANPRAALQLALWNAQVGKGNVPQAAHGQLSQAVSLLLAGRFAEATPVLEQLYAATSPSGDGVVRTLLAWSYTRTGRTDAAAKLLQLYPIVLGASGDDDLLSSLVFPRFVELRGEVLHSDKDGLLAAKYAGDLPDRVR